MRAQGEIDHNSSEINDKKTVWIIDTWYYITNSSSIPPHIVQAEFDYHPDGQYAIYVDPNEE